jgi:hypothetical protein
MSFIQQQVHSFLNLGICKEYPIMARSKSPTGTRQAKQKDPIANGTATPPVPAAAPANGSQSESNPEARKLEVVKNDPRPSVVPINLEDEIRRRAYELSEKRGFQSGYENEDWLNAEREVLQRYRQQSA